jgi:hypothetical protein
MKMIIINKLFSFYTSFFSLDFQNEKIQIFEKNFQKILSKVINYFIIL